MLRIFKIRRDERVMALVLLCLLLAFNALLICKYADIFTMGGNLGFWTIFFNNFHVSGYDALSYIALSNMRVHFNTLRHPLFFPLLLPFYWLNHWLMQLTGINFAVFIMAFLIVSCSLYSFLFLYRTFREIMGNSKPVSVVLTFLCFSFGHILLTCMVPDHFVFSFFLLTLTLYLSGKAMQEGRTVTPFQGAVLFFLTAGITVTNSVKTCLAMLAVNGRRVFHVRYIVALAVSSLLLCAIWVWQHEAVIVPQERAIKRMEDKKRQKDAHFDEKHKAFDERRARRNGKAIAEDLPLLEWSDVSTPRWPSVRDNLFGESLLLHSRHLLGDVQIERPVFVSYTCWVEYAVESLLCILFLAGLWRGRRNRLLQLAFGWFLADMVVHVGFGFGLNEVYIMAAHWAFVVPLAIGAGLRGLRHKAVICVLSLLTLYVFIHNSWLIAEYMLR
ncbi:MAG: DUF6080 domain-containing protein [Prevotella sp.]